MRKINLPRTIWWEKNKVKIIDQTKLPENLEILTITNCKTLGKCISEMNIRGAPALSAAGALGIALASLKCKSKNKEKFLNYLHRAAMYLKTRRPTAVNLSWAIDKVLNKISDDEDIIECRKKIITEAKRILEEDEKTNRKIGKEGYKLIKNGFRIETHCNAGSLAAVYYGTALAPIYYSWEKNKNLFVVVNETRPRLQGAMLTAWELNYVGIPYEIITDSMTAYYMKKKRVDLVIVGADRIAGNGDTANKIGTYSLALIAREHNVPFYVAAPLSTIDPASKTGDDIPIEERNKNEILLLKGKRLAPRTAAAWNPAFDITPAKLIRGIITEKGIIKANEKAIKKVLG